jgi:chromosome segregation ATPase
MTFIIRTALALIILLTLGSCVSNETDPRKGGLFSYNPKAYEKRLEEKKATLSETEAATEQAKQEGQNLAASKQEKQARHEALKKELAVLYAESGKLQQQLDQAKTANAGQEKKLKRLKTQVADLRAKTLATNNSGASDAAKQAEVARLQKRMDELLEEAATLSEL